MAALHTVAASCDPPGERGADGGMRPAQLLQAAGAIDLRKLEGAIGEGLPIKLKCEIFTDLNKGLREAMLSALGEAEFKKLGADGGHGNL